VMKNGELRMENEDSEKLKVRNEKCRCEALEQIKEKKYYEKYKNKRVITVGICFSEEERNIVEFEYEIKED
ncbi:PD-(D/E)XK nuclease domain-containing protein, partial [Caminibacter sp.]